MQANSIREQMLAQKEAQQAAEEQRHAAHKARCNPAKLTVARATRPINKVVKRTPDGEIDKRSGYPLSLASARVVDVPDVDAMEALLREVSDDPCAVIIQGSPDPRFEELYAGDFMLMSVGLIEKATGQDYAGGVVEIDGKPTIARTKANFRPSTWMLLDRDIAPGMPAELADLDDDEFAEVMDKILPGFYEAGCVQMASTSGRVLIDGEPMDAGGTHYWFQVEDPFEQFAPRMFKLALVNDLGFMKPHAGRSAGGAPWTIFDPTTFSHERVVYAGKPTVKGPGLEVGPPVITTVDGPAVNTALVPKLTRKQDEFLLEVYGVTKARASGGGRVVIDQEGALTLDTVVVTKRFGPITVRDFVMRGLKRERCQTPFRPDSTTWNGILRLDQNKRYPLLHDNGPKVSYRLVDEDKEAVDVLVAECVGKGLSKILSPRDLE